MTLYFEYLINKDALLQTVILAILPTGFMQTVIVYKHSQN